jgi:hypothetical protein
MACLKFAHGLGSGPWSSRGSAEGNRARGVHRQWASHTGKPIKFYSSFMGSSLKIVLINFRIMFLPKKPGQKWFSNHKSFSVLSKILTLWCVRHRESYDLFKSSYFFNNLGDFNKTCVKGTLSWKECLSNKHRECQRRQMWTTNPLYIFLTIFR